jgi:hypothetical protein
LRSSSGTPELSDQTARIGKGPRDGGAFFWKPDQRFAGGGLALPCHKTFIIWSRPVAQLFKKHDRHGVVIVDQDRPIGLINRLKFVDRFAQPYQREVHGRKSCRVFAEANSTMIDRRMPWTRCGPFLREKTSATLAAMISLLSNQSEDWQKRCVRAFEQFNERARAFFPPEDVVSNGAGVPNE